MDKKTQEAFELIVKVTGVVNATRQDHFNIQEALKTIERALTPSTGNKQPDKDDIGKEKKDEAKGGTKI